MCEKLAGQRTCSIERNRIKIRVFISEESKQSLTLGSKGVKRFVLYTHLFGFGFYKRVITLVIRLSLSPLAVGRALSWRFTSCFYGTEERQRAIPAPAAFWVISV